MKDAEEKTEKASIPSVITENLSSCLHVNSPQSCLTLCDPMDCSLPGSSVHGILQTRIVKWGCCTLLQGIVLTQELAHTSCISCTGSWVFYHCTWEARNISIQYKSFYQLLYLQHTYHRRVPVIKEVKSNLE